MYWGHGAIIFGKPVLLISMVLSENSGENTEQDLYPKGMVTGDRRTDRQMITFMHTCIIQHVQGIILSNIKCLRWKMKKVLIWQDLYTLRARWQVTDGHTDKWLLSCTPASYKKQNIYLFIYKTSILKNERGAEVTRFMPLGQSDRQTDRQIAAVMHIGIKRGTFKNERAIEEQHYIQGNIDNSTIFGPFSVQKLDPLNRGVRSTGAPMDQDFFMYDPITYPKIPETIPIRYRFGL